MLFRCLQTRVKTFRIKASRCQKDEKGLLHYNYDNPIESDKMINNWLRKEHAIIKDIKINEVVMQDKKDYNTIDLIYTIIYTKG